MAQAVLFLVQSNFGDDSFPWLTVVLIVLAFTGWATALRLWPRATNAAPQRLRPDDNPCTALPIHVLVMDLSAVKKDLDALHDNGLSSLASHLDLQPELLGAWQKRVRISFASPHSFTEAGASSLEEVQAWWASRNCAPWSEIFKNQVFLLWSDLRHLEHEIVYESERHEELTCHMRCTIPVAAGKPDFRQVTLSVTDITLAKGGKMVNAKDSDILRDIFAQANMLVWWARVRRENGRFLWRMRLPHHSSSSPLYKMAGALEVGGLWDMSRMPDASVMNSTSEEALLGGREGYSHDFRCLCADGTHWIHEDVTIQPTGRDEWSLVAVATDVTARHRAEEASEEANYQIQQILRSADVLLWRAIVTDNRPHTVWKMYVPPSVLYRRIFGHDPEQGEPLLWLNHEIPERAEIDARATRALHEGWPGYEQEFRVIARGCTFWLHEHVSITRKSATEWALVGVIMDVSARRLAEQALANEKARLSQAISTLQSAGISIDLPSNPHDSSPAVPAGARTPGGVSPAPEVPRTGATSGPASQAGAAQARTLPSEVPVSGVDEKSATAASPNDAVATTVSMLPEQPRSNTSANLEQARSTTPTMTPPTAAFASTGPSLAAADPARRTITPASAYEPLNARLLLMDDEEPIQRLAMRLIKRLGVDVEVSSDGNEALAKYKAALEQGRRFDIVMMDINVPNGMGAKETIGPLLKLDPDAKALVCSGASGDGSDEALLAKGFLGTIAKPYEVATLHRVFKSLLTTGKV